MSDDEPTLPRRSARLQKHAPEYHLNQNIKCARKIRRPQPYIQVRPCVSQTIRLVGLFLLVSFALLIFKDQPFKPPASSVVVFPNAPHPPHPTSSTLVGSAYVTPNQPFPAWKFDESGATTKYIQRRMDEFFERIETRQ